MPEQTATDEVLQAWREPGRRPDVHAEAKARLRRTWPVLFDALDRLDQASPVRSEPQLHLGDRVLVTADGSRLRSMMAHHLGRRGKVVAFHGGGLDGTVNVDVQLDHIGVVTFRAEELELVP